MDAFALLTRQGWRGTGHSLHATDNSIGLKHHLLIKRQKTDGAGLGSCKDEHQAEAWWMSAFDQALNGIDTSSGRMKQTLAGGDALDRITARGAHEYSGPGGLYAYFRLGGTLEGSTTRARLPNPAESGASTSAVADGKDDKALRDAKARRKAASLLRKEADVKAVVEAKGKSVKEAAMVKAAAEIEKKARIEKKRAKLEKKARLEQKKTKLEKKKAKLEKKKAKLDKKKAKVDKSKAKELRQAAEAKEERRALREVRRLRKARKRQKTSGG